MRAPESSSPTPFDVAIPDVDALVAAVYARATPLALSSTEHGPQHWQAVARAGADLLEAGTGASPAVVFAFALLHDSQRFDDKHDPEHGPRAAETVAEYAGRQLFLAEHELELLSDACRMHTAATISDEPTLGTCYDADRLNLWRCEVWPEAEYLSTEAARVPARIERCSELATTGEEWTALAERFRRIEGVSTDALDSAAPVRPRRPPMKPATEPRDQSADIAGRSPESWAHIRAQRAAKRERAE